MLRRLAYFSSLLCFLAAVSAVGGCAAKPRNDPLHAIDENYGYRFPKEKEVVGDTFVVLAFSGGGTRAAALAQGVLKEMQGTEIGPGEKTLLDEVDLVSSVSGGSVTAANFALKGPTGFSAYEEKFLKKKFIPHLVTRVINPIAWTERTITGDTRIDVLVDMFDKTIFNGATYDALVRKGAHPYLILNATDMTTGLTFPFTQRQFDLLCSDLSRVALADAVAASAAYPVFLTPVKLTNYAPCEKQFKPNSPRTEENLVDDLEYLELQQQNPERRGSILVSSSSPVNRHIALRELRLLDENKNFVHLLDGGISDNLGLGEPFRLLQLYAPENPIKDILNNRSLRRVAFIVVNARSDPETDYDRTGDKPGPVAMLTATVGAAIDNRSNSLLGEVEQLHEFVASTLNYERKKARLEPVVLDTVLIDFDRIVPDECRQAFLNIPTTWGLDEEVVDALMEMGAAMLADSNLVGNPADPPDRTSASQQKRADAQERAKKACDRLTGRMPAS